MVRFGRSLAVLVAVAFVGVCAPAQASTTLNLLPGTGVLASKSGSGPLSSTSSSTRLSELLCVRPWRLVDGRGRH